MFMALSFRALFFVSEADPAACLHTDQINHIFHLCQQ